MQFYVDIYAALQAADMIFLTNVLSLLHSYTHLIFHPWKKV